MICNKTLSECLRLFSPEVLSYILLDKNLRIHEQISHREKCEILAKYMLRPEVMEQYVSCLFDDEIERLEQGIDFDLQTGMRGGSEWIPQLLCQAEYAFRLSEEPEDMELFWLPYDVVEAYQRLQSDAFTEKRKQRNHFLSCLMAVGAFYGCVPLEVIAPVMRMSVDEVARAVEGLPIELNHYIVVGDMLFHRDLYLEDYGLALEQKDIPYYIPDEKELAELSRWGYLPTRPEMRALVGYLVAERNMEVESAEYAAMWIQKMIAANGCLEDVYEYLEEYGVLETGEVPEKLADLMEEFRSNTRMLANRGFTELELSGADPVTIFTRNKTIISFIF